MVYLLLETNANEIYCCAREFGYAFKSSNDRRKLGSVGMLAVFGLYFLKKNNIYYPQLKQRTVSFPWVIGFLLEFFMQHLL